MRTEHFISDVTTQISRRVEASRRRKSPDVHLIINTAEHPFPYAGKSLTHSSLGFLTLISKGRWRFLYFILFFCKFDFYFGKRKN